jgi:hypothetical protein
MSWGSPNERLTPYGFDAQFWPVLWSGFDLIDEAIGSSRNPAPGRYRRRQRLICCRCYPRCRADIRNP